jgi:hypothetical protein
MKRVIAVVFAVALPTAIVLLLLRDDDVAQDKVVPGKDARVEQLDVSEFGDSENPGWVFGRLVGATQTPGSSNYSPFGKATDSLAPTQ